MRKQGMPSRGVPRGGKKTNVVSMRTGKALTPRQTKARAKIDRVKKSPFTEDVRKGNLDNFHKIVRGKPRGKSVFGPIGTGKIKPKPKGK